MLRVVVVSCALTSFFLPSCSNNSNNEQGFVSDGDYLPFGGVPEEGTDVSVLDDSGSSAEVATAADADSGGDLSALPEADTAEPPISFPSVQHACNAPAPAGLPQAAFPKSYSGGACPTLLSGKNSLKSGSNNREVMVVVPDNLKDNEILPVLFLWHWLKGSAKSFLKKGQIQDAVNTQRFLAVIPEAKGDLFLQWPFDIFSPDLRRDEELTFFDDMLSCVSQQFNINRNCVGSIGVSAGALFTVQLAMHRSEYLSSLVSLSGGIGGVTKPWKAPSHKLPTLVLWGGPWDSCVLNNFQDTSHMLEDELAYGGHFVLECVHNCAHGEPPLVPPPGLSKYAAIWEFVFDHPFWLAPGQSPYSKSGLPSAYPNWCELGIGTATPRLGECEPPGCPF
jgi:predicted esterase